MRRFLVIAAAFIFSSGFVTAAAGQDASASSVAPDERAAQVEPAAQESRIAGGAEEQGTLLPLVSDRIAGLELRSGLLNLYVDGQRGKIWLWLPPAPDPGTGHQFLYVEGLASGMGSNDVGLDRGQIGETRLVALRRVGGRVLVEEVNLRFRALSSDPNEQRAVRQSFARSVLWGGEVVAEDADGSVLVDFTSFVVRDAHDSARRLEETGQGAFSLDAGRSAVDLEACLVFPDNIELEAVLTLAGKEPGSLVASTVPAPQSVTLVQHHSFLRLPEPGYRPRRFDPRAGSFAVSFLDYAAPLDAPLEKKWIVRHRLEKVDRSADISSVIEPIVYYIDRGVPEPVRSALLDGARWWAAAFDAAGFIDAYRVEMLPEGAHPLDARYNVIQWVHRSTRGWSYGGGVIDPRTGEMIKGHVSLGSLRVRQDRLLFEGLAGTSQTGSGAADDPVQLALARIRQLSAHEVGHTLGFSHNFAASAYGRASVMDYPAPLIGLEGETLDFSSAYGVGVGAWDIHATRYAYAQYAEGTDEDAVLEAVVQEGLDRGLVFLSDEAARPAGAAQPLANLWDNGDDPVAALEQSLNVRRLALSRFGEEMVAVGRPLALLQEVLAPVYFHHRYQLDAAVKVIGGLEYTYAVRGDGQPAARFIAPERQWRALNAVLGILDPATLDLPESVLERILPRPAGFPPHRELFGSRTSPVFDPLAAAATAASMVVEAILQPQRAARLVDFHRRDETQPELQAVLNTLVDTVFPTRQAPGARSSMMATVQSERHAQIVRVTQRAVVDGLIALASSPAATTAVRGRVDWTLAFLKSRLEREYGGTDDSQAERDLLIADIGRHLERPAPEIRLESTAPGPPPGSPIGGLGGCSQDPHPGHGGADSVVPSR